MIRDTAQQREVPAPGLAEVVEIWWDVEVDPIVRWSADGRRFALAVPEATEDQLVLAVLTRTPDDPRTVATVLAEGLAACDFPPTGDGAAPGRVRATLAAAGRDEELAEQ